MDEARLKECFKQWERIGREFDEALDRLSIFLDQLSGLVNPEAVLGRAEDTYWRCQVCTYVTMEEPEVWVCPMCGETGTQSVLVKVIPRVKESEDKEDAPIPVRELPNRRRMGKLTDITSPKVEENENDA